MPCCSATRRKRARACGSEVGKDQVSYARNPIGAPPHPTRPVGRGGGQLLEHPSVPGPGHPNNPSLDIEDFAALREYLESRGVLKTGEPARAILLPGGVSSRTVRLKRPGSID